MPDAKDSAGLAAGPRSEASPKDRGPNRLVPLALVLYGALLAVASVWRLWADELWPWRADSSVPPWPFPARAAAGLAYGALLIAASRLWIAKSEAGRRLSQELAAAVGPVSARQAILLAALSGLAEEAFFRGALQPRVGWVVASALFGLAHFHPRRELRVWSLSAFIAGLGFAALFEATGDLLAPALAHFLVNAINLRWLASHAPRELERPGIGNPAG